MQKLHFLINGIPSIKVKFNYNAQISFMVTIKKTNCSNYLVLYLMKTPLFILGLANLKRNPGENPGVDSIPLKTNVFSNKPKELLNFLRITLEADQN